MRPLLCLLLALPLAAASQAPAIVAGNLVDGSGAPMPYATVLLVGHGTGAVSDASGRFAFATRVTGRQRLRASSIGFETVERTATLASGDTTRVRFVLRESVLDLGEAVVAADAFVSGADVKGLNPLDVVTTPGAAADLFQAIRSFPGLTEAEEGAGLFVRGGDVSETRVILDGAALLQPYRFESPLGGTFGSVSPWLVSGTRFSTGGFSARYGGALSGVLAMESQNEPTQEAQTLSLSLAAASASADVTLGPGGVRAAANQSFTDALFWVNGRGDDFETAPRSTDGSLLAAFPTASGGRIKLLAMGSTDRLGVRVDEPSYAGVFESRASGGIALAQWTGLARTWNLSATLAHAQHGSEQSLGALRLRPLDRTTSLRTSAERAVSRRLVVHVGAEAERGRSSFRGEVPDGSGVTDPDATVTVFDQTERGTRGGAWAEAETQFSRRVAATVGLRADASGVGVTLDPRANVFVALSEATRVRFAAGLYSQAPDLATLALARGGDSSAPGAELGSQRAAHLIAGVTHERGLLTLRAEAYSKTYRELVLQSGGTVFGNTGRGHARGLDLFARWSQIGASRLSGWLSYSLLDARRTQVRRDGLGTALASGPPPFGVAHSFNAVGKASLWRGLSVSGRFRAALGRPVTPVVGAVQAPEAGFFYPVDGVPGSETLPAYTRLDLAASYTLGLGKTGSLVLFGALDNALDRANVNGYSYTADYASRTLDTSPYRRSVYVGASLLLSGR